MKKRMKALLASGLALLMLAGCGNQTSQDSSSQLKESENVSSQAASAQEDQSQETASLYPDYLNLDGYRPIVKEDEEVTLKIMVQRSNAVTTDINDVWFKQFIEEKLNINLEIDEVTSENVNERKNLMMASGELPDMMFALGFSANDIMKYGVDEELFLPLSDYFSEELTPSILETLEENEAARLDNTALDGKMYSIPLIYSCKTGYGDTLGMARTFIDTRYMEAAGITEVPDTLDGFVDMLRAFKALEPEVMGVDEIWPMVSVNSLERQYLMNAFGWVSARTDVLAPTWDVEKEEVVIPCLEEKYADYVMLLNTLYNEGLLHPDYYTMDATAARALMTEGKVPVINDWAPYLTQTDTWNEYVSAAPLKSEWSAEGIMTKEPASGLGTIQISASTEYPELCMRLLDYLYSPEGAVYSQVGCPVGSEDTLGLIEGFTWSEEEEVITHPDYDPAEYDGDYTFRLNEVMLFDIRTNEGLWEEVAMDMLGLEMKNEGLDVTNCDQNYRYLVYEAYKGHLVDGLPRTYMDTDVVSRYTDLRTVIGDYVYAETAKFVVGQRPLDELDDYFKELEQMGSKEYEEICKACYANYERPAE